MEKAGKIILIGIVLIAIAVPLGFLIKYNFSNELNSFDKQKFYQILKLDQLKQAKDSAFSQMDQQEKSFEENMQKIQEMAQQQAIENLTEISTSTWITYDKNSIFVVDYPDTWKIITEKPEELSFTLPEIVLKNALEDKGGVFRDSVTGLGVSISIRPVGYSNLEEYLNSEKSPANDEYFPTYNRRGSLFGKINELDFYRYSWIHDSTGEVYLAIKNKNLIEIRFDVSSTFVLSSDNPPTFNEISEYANFQKFLYSFKLK